MTGGGEGSRGGPLISLQVREVTLALGTSRRGPFVERAAEGTAKGKESKQNKKLAFIRVRHRGVASKIRWKIKFKVISSGGKNCVSARAASKERGGVFAKEHSDAQGSPCSPLKMVTCGKKVRVCQAREGTLVVKVGVNIGSGLVGEGKLCASVKYK